MDSTDKAQFTVVLIFLSILLYFLAYSVGERSSRHVCERMLQYEQQKTAEEARKLFTNELIREGRE